MQYLLMANNYTIESDLTFIALQKNSTVKLTKIKQPTVDGLQYRRSLNDEWTPYIIDTVITLSNVNDIVQFRNTKAELGKYVSSTFYYVNFVMTGSIKAARKFVIIN